MSASEVPESVRFKEIEHKFVVPDDFDLDALRSELKALGPTGTTVQDVRDVYYFTRHQPQYIYRHRCDQELQHLSVKSIERDSEVRLEVNLDLGQHRGDQQAAVEEFLATFDVVWRGVIDKQIEVYYFPDCEVVYYRAQADSRRVSCVEFEAVGAASLADALAILSRYEQRVGFASRERTAKTLVEILFPDESRRFRGQLAEAGSQL
ncbi:MAG: hypothetical protein AAF560_05310 [Acidobacteriota bacterium]